MNKIVLAALLLSTFVAAPAVAADTGLSVGVNYGLDVGGTLGFEGEYDLSDKVGHPIAVQGFYKSYSETAFAGIDWTFFGAAGIYDLSEIADLGSEMKPYAGLGFYTGSIDCPDCKGTIGGFAYDYTPSAPSGAYVTGGVRYSVNDQIDADFSYNNIGGLTIGGRFNF